jgi:hypothetical protein
MDWMVQHFYEEFIIIPYDEQFALVVADYERIGFPGAAGSVDCVHIPWDRCPYEYRQMNRSGKDGFPTRVFEVTVSHNRQIRAIAGSFPGAWNDKVIARFDGLIRKMRGPDGDPRFEQYEYTLLQRDGTPKRYRGLYLITDNGYHRWRCLIPPMTVATDDDEVTWSKHLESVRKDVECTFGSLETRFKILKISLMYRNVEHVDNVFYTCAILHNMLLQWDGRQLMESDECAPGYGELAGDVVGDGNKKAGQSKGYRKQLLHAGYDATLLGYNEMHCVFARVDEALPPADAAVKLRKIRTFTLFVEHWWTTTLHS